MRGVLMKVVRMNSVYERMFIDKLKHLSETSRDKNKDWYTNLQKDYIKFENWYFIIVDDNIVAFAAVHKIGIYYRILSRLWYDPMYRTHGLKNPTDDTLDTPAMLIAELQLEDYQENLFCSMEYPNRRSRLGLVAERLNYKFDKRFKLNDEMHLTCQHPSSFSCWQNTISEVELILPYISIEQWRQKFGNARKVSN